jgi:DNA-binding FadR family transcriptional regulator
MAGTVVVSEDFGMAEQRSFRRPTPPSVEDLLKDFIIERQFGPGDKLPTELEFADELGVSRNAVREALRSLRALGVVEIKHGHGLYVAPLSLARLADGLSFWSRLLMRDGEEVIQLIAEVRRVLECQLVGEITGKLTADDFAEMQAAVDDIARQADQGMRAFDADRRFHEALYRPLDNWILIGLLRAFWDSAAELVDSAPAESLSWVAAQHQDILDALAAEDPAAAVQAMEIHFQLVVRQPKKTPAAD